MNDFLSQTELAVRKYIGNNPGYSVDSYQPSYRGGTNIITFGNCNGNKIVYKYFWSEKRWQNELFCLKYLESTGLVPKVLDAAQNLIVMTRLSGDGLHIELSNKEQILYLSSQIGYSLGRINNFLLPEPSDGYYPIRDFNELCWKESLEDTINNYLKISRKAQKCIPAYDNQFCIDSLSLIEEQLPKIAFQKHILYHEDISNFMVDKDIFTGFYDLELCRIGTIHMQLGVVYGLCSSSGLNWESFLSAYENEMQIKLTDEDLFSILAMNHFYSWIRICRWGLWNGDKDDAANCQASEEDADYFIESMKKVCIDMSKYINVDKRFEAFVDYKLS